MMDLVFNTFTKYFLEILEMNAKWLHKSGDRRMGPKEGIFYHPFFF